MDWKERIKRENKIMPHGRVIPIGIPVPTARREAFLFSIMISTLLFCSSIYAESFSDVQIADAIFRAEGGYRAKYLYGIVSVSYKDEAEARKICLNTIRNNRKRFLNQTKYKDYLSFLASRYCPIGVSNDPRGLNANWLKNVRYFLEAQ